MRKTFGIMNHTGRVAADDLNNIGRPRGSRK